MWKPGFGGWLCSFGVNIAVNKSYLFRRGFCFQKTGQHIVLILKGFLCSKTWSTHRTYFEGLLCSKNWSTNRTCFEGICVSEKKTCLCWRFVLLFHQIASASVASKSRSTIRIYVEGFLVLKKTGQQIVLILKGFLFSKNGSTHIVLILKGFLC